MSSLAITFPSRSASYFDITASSLSFLLQDPQLDEDLIFQKLDNSSPEKRLEAFSTPVNGCPLIFIVLESRSDLFCKRLMQSMGSARHALLDIYDEYKRNVLQMALQLDKSETYEAICLLFNSEERGTIILKRDLQGRDAFDYAKSHPASYAALLTHHVSLAIREAQLKKDLRYYIAVILPHFPNLNFSIFIRRNAQECVQIAFELQHIQTIRLISETLGWRLLSSCIDRLGGTRFLLSHVKDYAICLFIFKFIPHNERVYIFDTIIGSLRDDVTLGSEGIYRALFECANEDQKKDLFHDVRQFPESQNQGLVKIYAQSLSGEELFAFIQEQKEKPYFLSLIYLLSFTDWEKLLRNVPESEHLLLNLVRNNDHGYYLITLFRSMPSQMREMLLKVFFFELMTAQAPYIMQAIFHTCIKEGHLDLELISSLIFLQDDNGETFLLRKINELTYYQLEEWFSVFQEFLGEEKIKELVNKRNKFEENLLDKLSGRNPDDPDRIEIVLLLVQHQIELNQDFLSMSLSCPYQDLCLANYLLVNTQTWPVPKRFTLHLALLLANNQIDAAIAGINLKLCDKEIALELIYSPLISHVFLHSCTGAIELLVQNIITSEEALLFLPYLPPNHIHFLANGLSIDCSKIIHFCHADQSMAMHLLDMGVALASLSDENMQRQALPEHLLHLFTFTDLAAFSQSFQASLLWPLIPSMNLSQLKVILPFMPIETIIEYSSKMTVHPLKWLTTEQKINYFETLANSPQPSFSDTSQRLTYLSQLRMTLAQIDSLKESALYGESETSEILNAFKCYKETLHNKVDFLVQTSRRTIP